MEWKTWRLAGYNTVGGRKQMQEEDGAYRDIQTFTLHQAQGNLGNPQSFPDN